MNSVKIAIFGLFMGLMPFVCNGMETDDNGQDSQNIWIQAFDEQKVFQPSSRPIARSVLQRADWPDEHSLSWAWFNRQTKIAQLLIEQKADVNPLDKNGEPLLLFWVEFSYKGRGTEMVQLLIDNGAFVTDEMINKARFPEMKDVLVRAHTDQYAFISKLRLFIQPYACDITLPVD